MKWEKKNVKATGKIETGSTRNINGQRKKNLHATEAKGSKKYDKKGRGGEKIEKGSTRNINGQWK